MIGRKTDRGGLPSAPALRRQASVGDDLSWLGKQLRPFLHIYGFAALCTLGTSLLVFVEPLLMKWLIDKILPQRNLSELFEMLALFLLAYLLRLSLNAIGGRATFGAIQKMTLQIRLRLLRHLNSLSYAYHLSVAPGEKLFRVERDVDQIAELGSCLLLQCLSLVSTTVLACGAMMYLSISLTVAILPLNVIFFVVRRYFRSRLQQSTELVQKRSSFASAFLQEHLSAISQVQLLRCERQQLCAAGRANIGTIRAEAQRRLTETAFSMSSMMTMAVGTTAVLGFGGFKVINGSLTTGTLVASYTYLLRLFDPLTGVMDLCSRFNRIQVSIRRVREIMETLPTVRQVPGARALPKESQGEIWLRDVHFRYKHSEELLRGLTIHIRQGTTVGIVGSSGRTTIARLIARLYDVHQGAVLIDGVDIREVSLASLRDAVCYVPQDPILFDRSLKENLLLGKPSADDGELRRVIDIAQLANLTRHLPDGWDTRIGPWGGVLSGGERQRLAVARAILRQPRVLILDESTSALDLTTERKVVDGLREMFPSQTMVFISHRLSSLQGMDDIILIQDGCVAEHGTHLELLRRDGCYSKSIAPTRP